MRALRQLLGLIPVNNSATTVSSQSRANFGWKSYFVGFHNNMSVRFLRIGLRTRPECNRMFATLPFLRQLLTGHGNVARWSR